ncbi:hypothetical protein CH64_3323 [Yersinia rohdei]|uniref:Filamentous haemagglutinin FhaB/tRNA nuclease CdiA-like TPS domain-containing protein n=2 Tax=Yersinia rohdei TaxID=29485 RepID=A0ABM5SB64_YERRO|nr:DUF637 domain-containing protein [Yersinia rohdei]AJJ10555.1 hypothetical protein CH64_3323 [Yersinia rohdei]EEQ03390.1 Large exoprotein involved in heme utilization or adhesion [Yersinia rohdei ATCC 43380]
MAGFAYQRIVSWLLVYFTAVQPLHPAIAAGIQPDNPQTQVQIHNEILVVNIATPNTAGVSHNRYRDFNVPPAGAVLNNANATLHTAQTPYLAANPHLTGNSAQLIINEVTSRQPSLLDGSLRVFGQKANVIIANPNGLSCNGCGFSNMEGITLTTGRPMLNRLGELDRLNVVGGEITVDDKGLRSFHQQDTTLISRTLNLKGKIYANQLDIILGANRINYQNGHIQPVPVSRATPALALDTSVLGGMYTDRIRLVSTEKGMDANLNNIVSNQGDITIDIAGDITSGNITAKKDLNITSKNTSVSVGSKLLSGRDITLVNTKLNNFGQINSEGDIRIFSDKVYNTGGSAKLHAKNQMWIQKDAEGNKTTLIENKSGTIKTDNSDLIIRTEKLDNSRQIFSTDWEALTPDSTHAQIYDYSIPYDPSFIDTGEISEDQLPDSFPSEWFDTATLRVIHALSVQLLYKVNTERSLYQITEMTPAATIYSGDNLYINATQLTNTISNINAKKDIFLTGKDFLNSSYSGWIKDEFIDYMVWNGMHHSNSSREEYWHSIWTESEKYNGAITTDGNVVFDFSNNIKFYPLASENLVTDGSGFVLKEPKQPVVKGNNILLHANTISGNDLIQARGDVTFIADDIINLNDAYLRGEDISITALNDINAVRGEIAGRDVMLLSRKGNIKFKQDYDSKHYLQPDQHRVISQINAKRDFSATAGNSISLTDTLLHPANNIYFLANNDINITHSKDLLDEMHGGKIFNREQSIQILNTLFSLPGKLKSHQDITFNAGNNLTLHGITLESGQDINLHAARDIDLSPRDISFNFDRPPSEDFFRPEDDYQLFSVASRTPELSAQINAKGNVLINAGRNILAQATKISADNNINLLAGKDIQLAAVRYSGIDDLDGGQRQDRHIVTRLHAGKALNVAANHQLLGYGAELTSGDDMTLTSGSNMRFESLLNEQHQGGGDNFSFNKLQQPTRLNSGGILTLISNGSILFQATQLMAKKVMDIAAEGGYLFAQAMEETSHAEQRWSSRKWWGRKKTHHNVQYSASNKVTEFTADGNISLLSRDDSRYQASKIAAGQNARLTSTHGKVIFEAVKNTTFEQKTTLSKGFYIKQSDKGYQEEKWVLPNIHTGGELTVDAAQGISADIKIQNGQSLRNAVIALSHTPGNQWLKDLNLRDDVQWQKVMDAYHSWDHRSQQLNPVVAVVIAIAVAAATAGSGLVAAAGAAAGGGMAGGAVTAGMSSLASQAAVSLVNNQGNISKTFKELGSKSSVKSLVTSMAVGGALSGFDAALGFDSTANSAHAAELPRLSNGDWSKTAQRVAGQSIIRSSLDTGINGGSFKDNLATALFANTGAQLHAEGAHLIGNNGQVLGAPGKALSHALVAGVAAEIGGGSGNGAAAGALAAELAGAVMGENFIGTQHWQAKSERQAQLARFLGGVVGAVFTGKAEGAYSGANAAEVAFRYNYLSHHQQKLMEAEMNAANTLADKGKVFIKWGVTSAKQDGAFAAGMVAGVPEGLYDSGVELVGLLQEPKQTFMALRELINSDDAVGTVARGIRQDWLARIDRMEAHYQQAGTRGAYDSGKEAGKLLVEYGGYATAAGGIAAGSTRIASKQVRKFSEPGIASVSQATTGIRWGQGIRQQGMPWENYVGTQLPANSRLPANFKTFDYYNPISRTAISVKTLDTTTAARVANPNRVYSSLKGNIDSAARFTDYTLDNVPLSSSMIGFRELRVAVPTGTTPTQWTQINRAIEYGQELGVKVIITTVK